MQLSGAEQVPPFWHPSVHMAVSQWKGIAVNIYSCLGKRCIQYVVPHMQIVTIFRTAVGLQGNEGIISCLFNLSHATGAYECRLHFSRYVLQVQVRLQLLYSTV